MPTYVQKTINSDLTPAWPNTTAFDKEMSAGAGADGSVVVSLIGSQVKSGGFITPPSVPNSDVWEDSGTWTVEIEVDGGNHQISGRCRCVRLDSAGNILESGAFTAAAALNSSQVFNPVAPAWNNAQEACGNRIAIEVEFIENSGMNQSVTIGLGTVANEVITDITEGAGSCGLTQLSFNETMDHSEAFVTRNAWARAFDETASVGEDFLKKMFVTFAESTDLAETFTKRMFLAFTETSDLAEALIAARQYMRSFDETADLAEAFVTRNIFAVVVAETASLAEAFLRKIGFGIAETASMDEAMTKRMFESFAESSDLAEAHSTRVMFVLALAEAASLAESLTSRIIYGLAFAEATDLAEAFASVVGKVFSEIASMAEALGMQIRLGWAETASMAESLTTQFAGGGPPVGPGAAAIIILSCFAGVVILLLLVL